MLQPTQKAIVSEDNGVLGTFLLRSVNLKISVIGQKSFKKKVSFLGDLKKPKLPSEIN